MPLAPWCTLPKADNSHVIVKRDGQQRKIREVARRAINPSLPSPAPSPSLPNKASHPAQPSFRVPSEERGYPGWTVSLTNKMVECKGLPGGSDSKESACSAGNLGLIPGSGRSPGEGNGYLLQSSCLENFMDRGAWQVTVHGVTDCYLSCT